MGPYPTLRFGGACGLGVETFELESPGNLMKRHRINDIMIMKYVNIIYLIQCTKQTVFVDSRMLPKCDWFMLVHCSVGI